jgi:hypothetical protein
MMLGMITGAGVLVVGFNAFEPVGRALGDWGKITIPQLFDSSPWTPIAALTVIAALALFLIARHEARAMSAATTRYAAE